MEAIRERLLRIVSGLSLTVRWDDTAPPSILFGELHGELLEDVAPCFLKAGRKVCNISAYPGLFPFVGTEADRFNFAIALLKENYLVRFGRISLIDATPD